MLQSALVWSLAVLLSMHSTLSTADTFSNKKVVCYFDSWSLHRFGEAAFKLTDIDPFLCTHAILGFVDIDDRFSREETTRKGHHPLQQGVGEHQMTSTNRHDVYKEFARLREKNPALTTMAAVGGWKETSQTLSRISGNRKARKEFAEAAVKFLKQYGYLGLDINWQYPTMQGGGPDDKKNFVKLLEETRKAFKEDGFTLSVTVSGIKEIADAAYDVKHIAKEADFINLDAYDYPYDLGASDGANSPLFPSYQKLSTEYKYNVDYTVDYWVKRGAPAEKLVLGMAAHGRLYYKETSHPHFSPKQRNGVNVAYRNICRDVQEKWWTTWWDNARKVPFADSGFYGLSYDNRRSIADKCNFVRKHQLGGGMLYSIDNDDFRGVCGSGAYPLLTSVWKLCGGYLTTPTTTESPPATQQPIHVRPTPPVTQPHPASPVTVPSHQDPPVTKSRQDPAVEASTSSSSGSEAGAGTTVGCTQDVWYADAKNCSIFYRCVPDASGGSTTYQFVCPPDLIFNPETDTCDYPYNVPDCHA